MCLTTFTDTVYTLETHYQRSRPHLLYSPNARTHTSTRLATFDSPRHRERGMSQSTWQRLHACTSNSQFYIPISMNQLSPRLLTETIQHKSHSQTS